ncbi:alpha-longipinene synthase-like [Cryptomeria japonica]|uniref:alpha-longipinene synthase-like n=1 Tax=Cryptomeria japonica TaxID=3369 RepID=UPI0027DA3FB8|nr:alpha-longipinene synthase-like [Cryptomeria japonica]
MKTLDAGQEICTVAASIPDNAFNVWDDDFVQSMQTPYGEPGYRKRAETLVKEVKIEGLEMVDALHCLGIDRYFDTEIKLTIDSTFRSWDTSIGIRLGSESVSSRNLNATALGLRLLRLHRYDVSADVLESFKDENGHFSLSNSKEECAMRGILNLLRASSVAFPRETVMEEAKMFSSAFLKTLPLSLDAYNASFLKEVEYALVYEWSRTFTRWEAPNFIEIYELDDLRLKDKKILELAKLDFNILQFMYKMEMKNLSRWWVIKEGCDNSSVSKLIAMRERSIEYFLWGVSAADAMEFSCSRIAIAKISTVATIVDDLFDDYATLDQVKLIKQAIVQGWDVSVVKNIPQNFKMCVEFIFKTMKELINEATKKQGRDMMPFIMKAWEDYIEANLEHARWKSSGYVPTYNEYLSTAITSAAIGPILLHPILLAGPVLSDDAIEKMFLNKSRFYELIWMCIRLIDDTRDFEDDRRHGEIASTISSYMRDHPECSEVEALNYITNLVEELLKELRWIYLNPNNSLLDWEKICFDFNRGLQFLYIFGDGITYSHKEVKHQVFKVFVDPVVI